MGANITKVSEKGAANEKILSDFCGRKKDVEKIVKLIKRDDVKTLCVHGPKSIGKTRVVRRALVDERMNGFEHIYYIDLSLFSEDCCDTDDFVEFLKDLSRSMGLEIKDKIFKSCEKCDFCSNDTGCSTVLKRLTMKLLKLKGNNIICFDSADCLLSSKFKPEFLNFINTVTEQENSIKIIVTSNIRFHMSSNAMETHLVDKMEFRDLKKLMVHILERSREDVSPITSLNIQDPWIDAIVILCDGIPKCAETLGTILKEDGCLIEPIELVQLLLTNFLQVLNPDLFPAEDRPAEKYNEVLKKLKEISEAYEESWLYNITDTMEGSEITPDEGLKAVRDDGSQVAKGTFKMYGLRKWIDYNILQKREKTSEALSMQTLYQHLLLSAYHLINDKDDDGLNLKTYIGERGLKLMKSEAKRVGVDLDHVGKLDAMMVERVLTRRDRSLKRDDSGRSSGEEHEDDSGNDSNEDNGQRMDNLTTYIAQSDGQALNSGYRRFDSTSGPFAMSYRPTENDIHATSNNVTINSDQEFSQGNTLVVNSNSRLRDCQDDSQGTAYLHPTELDHEHSYLRGATHYIGAGYIDTAENVLSNTYPTTKLRKGLQPQENPDDTIPKRERTSSTNEICVSHVHRMSSEEYKKSIDNQYVGTAEANNAQEPEGPTKHGNQTRVRYSDSSTDSGEFKLGFETKTFANEK